jgi:predicted O-methyltransferase YrrM
MLTMRRPARTKPSRGNYLPVLMEIVNKTTGPILELGSGMYSTPYLHWACFPERTLITYEDNPDWIDYAKQFETDYHKVVFVEDWEKVEFPECDVAFIDHEPRGRRRCEEIKKLTDAKYVVAHDAENSSDHKYGYSTIHHLFKYRKKFSVAGSPFTAVFSNKVEL